MKNNTKIKEICPFLPIFLDQRYNLMLILATDRHFQRLTRGRFENLNKMFFSLLRSRSHMLVFLK